MSCKLQELLPSLGKEDKQESDKKASTASMKAWLVGLTKKKKDAPLEEGHAAEPEPVLVRGRHLQTDMLKNYSTCKNILCDKITSLLSNLLCLLHIEVHQSHTLSMASV